MSCCSRAPQWVSGCWDLSASYWIWSHGSYTQRIHCVMLWKWLHWVDGHQYRGGLNARSWHGSHGNYEVKLLKVGLILKWGTFLALGSTCILPQPTKLGGIYTFSIMECQFIDLECIDEIFYYDVCVSGGLPMQMYAHLCVDIWDVPREVFQCHLLYKYGLPMLSIVCRNSN